jgi:hypothetical protein
MTLRSWHMVQWAQKVASVLPSRRAHAIPLLYTFGVLVIIENGICGLHFVNDDRMEPTLLRHQWWCLSDVCLVDKVSSYFSMFRMERGDVLQVKCALWLAPMNNSILAVTRPQGRAVASRGRALRPEMFPI